MTYAPHTFELTLYLGYEKYNEYLKQAYANAEKKHRVFKDRCDENKHCDETLKEHDIRIFYIWNNHKKRITLIVNPSKVLGGDDIPKLWKPNKSSIVMLLTRLEKHIKSYFKSQVVLSDFKLTRMDFTVNMKLGTRDKVTDYIKVLQNIGKVKGFSQMKDVDWVDKSLAFALHGNSNDINFWAYDKEGRETMLNMSDDHLKSARGILRVEVQVTTNRALTKYTNKTAIGKQIEHLAKNSKHIFMDTFTRIVPHGDFYKKGKAVELIQESLILTKKEKEKMAKLVKLVPIKKSLLLAQKGLKSKDIKGVMKLFESINVNPVTISKRHGAKKLCSLFEWL